MTGSGFFILARHIDSATIEKFDLTIIHLVQGFETPVLTMIFKTFTTIGSGVGVTLITIGMCGVFYFLLKQKHEAILLAITVVSTIMLNEALKQVYKRARPEIHRLMEIGGFSFPSGHTMMAFSLYGMLTYLLWHTVKQQKTRIIVAFVTMMIAFTIAISRIYVGVHFPSDIVGGILCSTFWVATVLLIDHVYCTLKKRKA